MITIKFPNGDLKEFQSGITPIEIAKGISKSLAKKAVAFEINGKMVDPTYTITEDAEFKLYEFSDRKGKDVYWHSSAHILAEAVIRLFPDVKIAFGPAIEEGFYYDFDHEPFTDEDLIKIEKEMKKIVKAGNAFTKKIISKEEALNIFTEKKEIYKTEFISELDENVEISIYTQGAFTDFCRGPHLLNTSKVKEIKLLSTSGAYWRGDVKNPMLQRIYGITFPTKEEMDLFLKRREEAKKRDHRKLGKDLDLFSFLPEAPGIPFYHNKGMLVREKLIEYWREEHRKDNYQEIQTPLLMTKGLWETSGHWDNYRENMFTTETEGVEFAVKPMNCPGGMLWYRQTHHSYRELPMRVAELGHVHRNEFSGSLSGLFRVRSFVQDDAHIFMREEQIKDEVLGVLNLLDRIYTTFGLDYSLELSTKPEKAIGTDEQWEIATSALREALEEYGRPYSINEGDGAFYGPKIDIPVKNALGKEWQCGTIQLDMQLPERFDLTYIDDNSNKQRVIMVHRALYGSIERFLGIILEHFGGYLPLWVAPIQVSLIPVSEKFADFAKKIANELKKHDIRVDLDLRNEKVGYKIREADGLKKINYMLVIGEKEVNEGFFSVRKHKEGDIGEFKLEEFINILVKEIKTKALPTEYKIEL